MKDYLIVPSILSADFSRLGEEITKVITAGADMIHFDVMDNHYVPNIGIGSMVLKSLRNYGITVPIDVHLMVKPVLDSLVLDFIAAGASYISFHPEATNHVDHLLQLIKDHDCKAGLAFNPGTSFSYLEYVISKLDVILLMLVNPGFSGQSFIPYTLHKVRQARRLIDTSGYDIKLAIDGGIKVDNISILAQAGADVFISGSGIFNESNYDNIISVMRCALIK